MTAYFHGTVTTDLDQVRPANELGIRPIHWNETDPDYAYATTGVDTAWYYAELAWNHTDGAEDIPRVYEVRPLGTVEVDPGRDARDGDHRCKDGWAIIRELPTPDHWKDDE